MLLCSCTVSPPPHATPGMRQLTPPSPPPSSSTPTQPCVPNRRGFGVCGMVRCLATVPAVLPACSPLCASMHLVGSPRPSLQPSPRGTQLTSSPLGAAPHLLERAFMPHACMQRARRAASGSCPLRTTLAPGGPRPLPAPPRRSSRGAEPSATATPGPTSRCAAAVVAGVAEQLDVQVGS